MEMSHFLSAFVISNPHRIVPIAIIGNNVVIYNEKLNKYITCTTRLLVHNNGTKTNASRACQRLFFPNELSKRQIKVAKGVFFPVLTVVFDDCTFIQKGSDTACTHTFCTSLTFGVSLEVFTK